MKNRTESAKPYTITQVEDGIFLNKDFILTLEYNFYQNGCIYSPLSVVNESINEKGVLVDEYDNEIIHKLGTHDYQTEKDSIHPMSMWPRENIKNLRDSGVDILKQERYSEDPQFISVDKCYNVNEDDVQDAGGQQKACIHTRFQDNEDMMAEAILALYKITKQGKMMRHNSITMSMGKKFFPSKNGNMTLTRSKDKKVISVVNFD